MERIIGLGKEMLCSEHERPSSRNKLPNQAIISSMIAYRYAEAAI